MEQPAQVMKYRIRLIDLIHQVSTLHLTFCCTLAHSGIEGNEMKKKSDRLEKNLQPKGGMDRVRFAERRELATARGTTKLEIRGNTEGLLEEPVDN